MADVAIVTVDVQRAFFDRRNGIGRPEKAICLDGIRGLVSFGRRAGWRIVHVVTEHETAATLPVYLRARGRAPYCAPNSSEAELMPGVQEPGDYRVVKHAYSGFGNTTLAAVVAGVPDVIVCGVAADCCVLATVFDGSTTFAKAVYVPYQAVGAARADTPFHLADFFIDLNDEQEAAFRSASKDIHRFIELVMGSCIHTPTIDEHFMFLANAVALRSGALGRQVGAVIGTPTGELISSGANEVPRAGGGQYWPNEHYDHRDVRQEQDASNVQRRRIIAEIIEVVRTHLNTTEIAPIDPDEILERLSNKRFASVIEFSRTVHAEMEAILSAARRGAPIDGTHLYTTTFPCHECARLIVGAGIDRVVYIEPYPKSLAAELFEHELTLDDDPTTKPCPSCARPHKVRFVAFNGVGPHRYMELFGLATAEGQQRRRKDAAGKPIREARGKPTRPLSPLSYIEREARAGIDIRELLKPPTTTPATPEAIAPADAEPQGPAVPVLEH